MNNVQSLFPVNPERTSYIRQWHQEQAAKADTVAGLHISITSAGKVRTEGVAIEPAHAAAMLEALKAATVRLEAMAGEAGCLRQLEAEALPCNVVRLHRSWVK